GFLTGDLHVTKEKLSGVGRYRQLAAFCCPHGLGDADGFRLFFRVAETFRKAAAEAGYAVSPDGDPENGNFTLTVEDARILNGDPRDLGALIAAGVGLLTPLWGGTTCIGGAHDTDAGLTPFGKEAVRECARRGIPVDVSHASVRSADAIFEILADEGMPPIATHSNAYSVCRHSRNLRDGQIDIIREAGGLVGVSLCPRHLTEDGAPTSEDAARHILYYLEKLGSRGVALGCDFDGIGSTPTDIRNVAEIGNLRDALTRLGVDGATVNAVFYENAAEYFAKIRKLKGSKNR
ncbi:MAG: membrane dipeptidase, partial [Clostridia bacterium]|nr:membrane dipeptidase [Clostridia bacterium]